MYKQFCHILAYHIRIILLGLPLSFLFLLCVPAVTASDSYGVLAETAGTSNGLLSEQQNTISIVNTTGDDEDLVPGDGLCATSGGKCTLRAALMEANAGGSKYIYFNIPSPGPHVIQPQSALPLVERAMVVDGYTQPGAHPNSNPAPQGLNTQLMIALDGSQTGGSTAFGFNPDQSPAIDGLIIRGLAIYDFGTAIGGGYEEGYNVIGAQIVGNFIGTDVTGTTKASNGWSGVEFSGAQFKNIDIGGVYPEDRNLVKGIYISSRYPEAIRIQGNLIGTDISGQRPLGNGSGIYVSNASDIFIGGADSGATNVISGNFNRGIGLDGNDGITTIRGNLIGLAADGQTPLGNGGDGINVFEHAHVTIEGNTIAHNQGNGINLVGDSNSTVSSNIISGNNGNGIKLERGYNSSTIQGNLIGLAADGQSPLGNGGSGIYTSSYGTVIANENRIAYNQGNGLTILQGFPYFTSYLTTFLPNDIFNNVGLGIDLLNDGVTPNDPFDSDTGPNDLQNYPVLESVVHSNGSVTVYGNLNSRPDRTYTLWFFTNEQCDPSGYGEGEAFAKELVVTTDSNGNAPFSAVFPQQAERPFVTATASYNGAISEFSQCRADPLYLVTLLRTEVQQIIDDDELPTLAGIRLLAKLDNVEAALLMGHENTAVLRLQDFIASVRNLMNRRQLPQELGQPLIDAAWAIIHQINLP